MAQVRTNPATYRLPPDAVEQLDKRLLHKKVFRRPDGTNIALFSAGLHYEPIIGQGAWEDSDTLFRASGQAQVADHLQHSVRVQGRNLDVTDRATGKGMRFTLPLQNTVAGNTVSFVFSGINWSYTVTARGVKLAAVVAAPVGPKHLSFAYARLGGAAALSLQLDGSVQGDGFVLPAPFAVGANGVIYPAGAWTFTDTALEFDWNDAALPPTAFPYTLDPSTSFVAVAGTEDGNVQYSGPTGSGWPPSTTFSSNGTASTINAAMANDGAGTYTLGNMLSSWDTSSLTDTIFVTRAWVSYQVGGVPTNVNAKTLIGDFYDWGASFDSADWTDVTGTDFHLGTPISEIGTTNTIADFYVNDVSQINLTGNTRIRWGLTPNTAPSGNNRITFNAFERGTGQLPTLFVEYLDPPLPSWPTVQQSTVIRTTVSNAGASTTPYSAQIAHGLTSDPKFLIAFAIIHSGGAVDGLQISQGFWANGKDRAVGMAVQDAQTSLTGLYRAVSNNKIILIPSYTGAVAFGVDVTSVDDTNINVDITDNIGGSTQIDLCILAVADPNIQADVQDITIPNGGQQYGTDINFGFKPELMFCLSADDTTWAETITNGQAMLSFGACDDRLNQWTNVMVANFQGGVAKARKAVSNDAIRAALNYDGGNWGTAVITALTNTGATWFVRDGSTTPGSTRQASVLGIKGVQAWVGQWDRYQYKAIEDTFGSGGIAPEAMILCTSNAAQRDSVITPLPGIETGSAHLMWSFGMEAGPGVNWSGNTYGVAAIDGGVSSNTFQAGAFVDIALYKTEDNAAGGDGAFFVSQVRKDGGGLQPIYSQFGTAKHGNIQFVALQPKQRGSRVPRRH